MKKNKPRWKDLPFYERFARTCKRNGSADWMVEHIRERGKQKEKERGWIEKGGQSLRGIGHGQPEKKKSQQC